LGARVLISDGWYETPGYLDRRALLGELAVDGEHMSFAVWKLANPG
jgi:hypothetical protein